LQQGVAWGQGADGSQVQLLQLPVVTFVLAQFHLQDFNLGAEGEAFGVVVEVVVGHAQAVFTEGFVAPGADASLPGTRLMAVFRQAGRRDL